MDNITAQEVSRSMLPHLEGAFILARTYHRMLCERDRLDAFLNGGGQYMTERFAMKRIDLSSMKRKHKELMRKRHESESRITYTSWKIDIIEHAMEEKMTLTERNIFRDLYYYRETYIREMAAYRKPIPIDWIINQEIRAISAIRKHLMEVYKLEPYRNCIALFDDEIVHKCTQMMNKRMSEEGLSMITKDEFAANLKSVRERQKITMSEMAMPLGMSAEAYSRLESGDRRSMPDFDAIKYLAYIMYLPLKELIGSEAYVYRTEWDDEPITDQDKKDARFMAEGKWDKVSKKNIPHIPLNCLKLMCR